MVPSAAGGTLGTPSPAGQAPESSSAGFWGTAPGPSANITGTMSPWPKCRLHLRPPPVGPGQPHAGCRAGGPCPALRPAARMPPSSADWNPSSPGRPRALLSGMGTQTSNQNPGPSQASCKHLLHLVLSCLIVHHMLPLKKKFQCLFLSWGVAETEGDRIQGDSRP